MKIEILILLTTVISVILALHPDNGYGKIVGGVEAPKRKLEHVRQIVSRIFFLQRIYF